MGQDPTCSLQETKGNKQNHKEARGQDHVRIIGLDRALCGSQNKLGSNYLAKFYYVMRLPRQQSLPHHQVLGFPVRTSRRVALGTTYA